MLTSNNCLNLNQLSYDPCLSSLRSSARIAPCAYLDVLGFTSFLETDTVESVYNVVYVQVDKSLLIKQQFANNMLHFYHVPFKENKTEDLFVIHYMIFVNKKGIQKHIGHMIDKKKINTAAYVNFDTTSPCELQGLPQDFLPAVALTFIKSRSGFRVIFYDKENNQCKPGIDKFHGLQLVDKKLLTKVQLDICFVTQKKQMLFKTM